jgi:thiol-disulfide isomerase/thioredoxin
MHPYTTGSGITLHVSRWFNTSEPLTIDRLKGRVVIISAFQMLCPACVSHSIPQLKKLDAMLPKERVAIVGLHTVFEHHSAMTPVSLGAFIHEYRLSFPIGVDAHQTEDPIPQTMRALQLRGTPSTIIIDQQGQLCVNHFGHLEDLNMGLAIGQLL